MAWSDRSKHEVARGFVSCATSAEELESIDGATVTVCIQVSVPDVSLERKAQACGEASVPHPSAAVGQLPLSRVEVLASPTARGPSVR